MYVDGEVSTDSRNSPQKKNPWDFLQIQNKTDPTQAYDSPVHLLYVIKVHQRVYKG